MGEKKGCSNSNTPEANNSDWIERMQRSSKEKQMGRKRYWKLKRIMGD